MLSGRHFLKKIVKVKIGEVQTTHPRAGQRAISRVPVPTDKVLKVLAKLTDLPKEAEKELKTKEEMQKKIRELQFQVRQKPRPEIDEKAMQRESEKAYNKGARESESHYTKIIQELNSLNSKLVNKLNSVRKAIGESPEAYRPVNIPKSIYTHKYIPPVHAPQIIPRKEVQTTEYTPEGIEVKFGRCEKMILKFLLTQPERMFTKSQIGAITGYSSKSGGFNNALSLLRKQNLIWQKGDNIQINLEETNRAEEISSDIQLNTLKDWLGTLPAAERKIFDTLMSDPYETYTKERLGEITGYSHTSGGFNNALSHLYTLGLIQKSSEGVKFNEAIQEWL